MQRAKNRRSFKYSADGKQKPSTFNTSVQQKHTYMVNNGEIIGCSTKTQQLPIKGYRKQTYVYPRKDQSCNDIPINTVYTDKYALNKQTGQSCISYKQTQPPIQNKNGCINSGYNYSTKQLLSRRNHTYEAKQFNFLSNNTNTKHLYNIIDASCIHIKDSMYNCDKFKRFANVNQNDLFAVYNPNNTQYSQQGAVSGGSRINRLKYQTTLTSQARYVKNVNNIVNGEYPATLYQNGGPIRKSILNKENTQNCKRTQNGLAQRCKINSTGQTATVPGAPTLATPTTASWTVYLTWAAPSNNGGASITSYKIEQSTTSATAGFAVAVASTGSTAIKKKLTTLNSGQAYWFKVSAINTVGTGTASAVQTATPPTTVPGLPTLSALTAGDAEISLSWTAPSSNGGASITSYKIEQSTTSATAGFNVTYGTGSTATSNTITGLTNGQAYWFKVSAINSVGTSTASAVQTATPPTVPGAPTLATPTTGSAQISLSWTAPSSNGGASITSYKIEQSTTSATAGFNVTYGTGSTATSNTITGLTNGQAYWFKVSAINSVGTSTASAVQTATPPTVPGAPTLATPTTGSAQISLSWTAPSSNGGASITSYKIEQSTTSATAGFNVTYGTGSTATSNTITGLTNGQAYWFKVSAINSVGTSTASPAKAGPLFSFTHHTFTACDASGNLGPTSEQCSEAYKAESWNNKTFFNMGEYADQGKQYWTVPLTGIYSIEAMGADGGDGISSELRGGSGAKMSSRFQLEIGETLVILVGQKGYVRSGGGGTFVTTVNTSQSSHTEGDDVDYTSVPQGPEVLAVLAQINAELDNVVPNESFLKLWREVSLPVARVKDIEAHKLKASILIIAGGGVAQAQWPHPTNRLMDNKIPTVGIP